MDGYRSHEKGIGFFVMGDGFVYNHTYASICMFTLSKYVFLLNFEELNNPKMFKK